MELMEFIAAEYNRFNNERDPELSIIKLLLNLNFLFLELNF